MCPVRAPFLLLNLIIEFLKKKKKEVRAALFLDNFKRLSIVCKELLSILLSEIKYILLDVMVSLSIFTGCAVF